MNEILQMTRSGVAGSAATLTLDSYRVTGEPVIRGEPVWRDRGDVFLASVDNIRELLARGAAKRPSGKLLALAEPVLQAVSPGAAALAGFGVPGVTVWHATSGLGGYPAPAPAAIGATRGGFEARFYGVGEIEAHWRERPAATPLFSFIVDAGFRRAFILRGDALREIPTSVNTI